MISAACQTRKVRSVLAPPNLNADAPWKQRFRAPSIAWFGAGQNPGRGLLASNKDGVYQLYAWDTASNRMNQLTDEAAGVFHGSLEIEEQIRHQELMLRFAHRILG